MITMIDHELTDRWRISCHESGHAICGLELNGVCDGLLISASSGSALVRDLYGDRHSYMIAAGPVAERLAKQHDAPIVEKVVSPAELVSMPTTDDIPFALANACSLADMDRLPRSAISDERYIALWAITHHERDPDRWAERVKFCYHIAEKIVEKNSESILRVARALFERGRLTGHEIKNLLRGDARNEC